MRLDVFLVTEKHIKSRSLAQQLIQEGQVLINGIPAVKPNTTVQPHDSITITELPRFVSRAGKKLEKALEYWNIALSGKTVLDIGSSTGGFTDCALQHGAEKVIAVDVGTDQFDRKLKTDPRIKLYEQTDIRDFTIDTPVDIVVCDVSFISLHKIIPHLSRFIQKGVGVFLIKPQFEVGKDFLNKQGVVNNAEAVTRCVEEVLNDMKKHGWRDLEVIDSPILGGDGNKEFLLKGVI